MDVKSKIDQIIRDIWITKMPTDYNNSFLLKEDSFKNVFYYHLRSTLTDGFLKRHRIRIFTEYYLGKDVNGRQNYADIAIVKIRPKYLHGNLHLSNLIEETVAIIELKFLYGKTERIFLSDIQKVKAYIKSNQFGECKFYLGFIHEKEHEKDKISWLNTKEKKTWACGKVSELVACYSLEENKMIFDAFSY